MGASLPRIAWFAAASGDVDYLARLLIPELQSDFEIVRFSDSEFSDSIAKAARTDLGTTYDMYLYHMESHPRSYPARVHLGLVPGVVVFHNLFITTDGPETIHASPWIAAAKKFRNEGPWPERNCPVPGQTARALREMAYAIKPIVLRRKLLMHLERSVAVRIDDQAIPEVLPLPVEVHPIVVPRAAKIVFCGEPQIEFRAHKVLQAISMLKEPCDFHWLIDRTEETAARELLEEFGGIRCTLHFDRTPSRWFAVAADAAAALHPFFPTFATMSPYMEISLAAAVPVIHSANGELEVPATVGIQVPLGDCEATSICAALQRLTSSNPSRDMQARQWAQEHLGVGVVAEQWRAMLHRVLPHSRNMLQRWRAFQAEAQSALKADAGSKLIEDAISQAWVTKVRQAIDQL